MGKVIHHKKFDGGRRSPQEYHAEFGFPPTAKCQGCQAKPSIRGIVMVPLDDAEKSGLVPVGAAAAPIAFPDLQPVLVKIREGGAGKYYVRVSLTYSCTRCQKDFEKALAKAPSWAIVEINYGPDHTNRVTVGV